MWQQHITMHSLVLGVWYWARVHRWQWWVTGLVQVQWKMWWQFYDPMGSPHFTILPWPILRKYQLYLHNISAQWNFSECYLSHVWPRGVWAVLLFWRFSWDQRWQLQGIAINWPILWVQYAWNHPINTKSLVDEVRTKPLYQNDKIKIDTTPFRFHSEMNLGNKHLGFILEYFAIEVNPSEII